MADTKDKDAILQLYNQVLPKIAEQVFQNLTEVIPLFDDFKLEKIVDTWTKDRENPSEKPLSLENGNVAQMGLRVQLLGFQRPGATAFDVVQDLAFTLEHTGYSVGPDRQTTWLSKNYFQKWTADEIENVTSRWSDALLEDITQQVAAQS